MLKNQLLCCWAIAFLLASEVTVNLTPSSGGKWLNINQEAFARSSGGSTGGRSSSSSSSSRSSNTSPSSSSSNSRSNSAASSSPSRPSNSDNTGGRVRSGSFDKPAAPAPVAAPNAPISPQSSNNRTVIIQQRTYNSGPTYVVPYNSGNAQQNIGSNQQPATNPAPLTTNNNSGDSDISSPSSDTSDNTQQNIGSEQQPAINAPAPTTTDNNSDSLASSESNDDWKNVVFWLFVAGGCVALIAYCIYYYRRQNPAKESKKHIFAVTKLQIAMLAEAREVPTQLTELALNYDTKKATQRSEFLQEAVLIVLRNRETWTHVCANSQIVESREEATQIFNQISMQERSKLSVETLSVVNGDIHRRQSVSAGEEPGEYIAVTFVIGTEDSRPLFGDIRDVAKLKAVLEKSATTPAQNLLILEVIWSPQQETDSLTGDDLLGAYPDLIRIG